jgi:hypothetical protein
MNESSSDTLSSGRSGEAVSMIRRRGLPAQLMIHSPIRADTPHEQHSCHPAGGRSRSAARSTDLEQRQARRAFRRVLPDYRLHSVQLY